MDCPSKETLARMPLAEGVLWLWRWVTCEERLSAIWEQNRGRCYEKVISFPVMVHLIADALMHFGGSGRHSFEQGIADNVLESSIQAAYKKLGRLPIEVSQAFLKECTMALRSLFPESEFRQLPKSLSMFRLLTLDGKTIKRVAKRLLPLRGVSGGLVGGKALVAREWNTGLAVAMQADADGDTNEVRLVDPLLPQVRHAVAGPRLWMGDCAFCDLNQPRQFTVDPNDHYLVRYHPKVKFHADPQCSCRKGADEQNRPFVEDWGWIGGDRDKRRRYVRRITLPLETENLILVTDLLDPDVFPAVDLLAVYGERWSIEHMFQDVTEVFGLKGLIGGTPKACLFQLSFCLLLHNMIQVVRSYLAEGQQLSTEDISGEKLFEDIKDQLIAWNIMIDLPVTIEYFHEMPTAVRLRTRLHRLIGRAWNERWRKSPPQAQHNVTERKSERTHHSTYRILQANGKHRLATKTLEKRKKNARQT
jgi:hypothetical protein